jgi:serine/threonine protein kinase
VCGWLRGARPITTGVATADRRDRPRRSAPRRPGGGGGRQRRKVRKGHPRPTAGAMSPSMSMSPTITTPAMTQAGVILGTAAYMSPEQAKGRPADKRSDVWAFGCVLYEMLTGARAFQGDDVSDTLAAVLRSEPNWTTLPAGTPPADSPPASPLPREGSQAAARRYRGRAAGDRGRAGRAGRRRGRGATRPCVATTDCP